MGLRAHGSSRRLADFLVYSQRYRIGMVALAVIWYAGISLLNLELESGEGGTTIMGILLGLNLLIVLAVPRAARTLDRRGVPANLIYSLLLVIDALLFAAAIPLTGGKISIVFIMYYLLAIGNCYMFNPRGAFWANTFMGATYVGTLLIMYLRGDPYAPALLDWVDILLVRIPLIYVVSGYARWLAQRGDRLVELDEEKYLETLRGFVSALEARDGYTLQHSRNVAYWSANLARRLGANEEEAQIYLHAGELHDIGKIGIPDSILNKPGPLTPSEYIQMQQHPLIGLRITQHLKWFGEAHQVIVRNHHERWDGKGYPDRLAGAAIPYHARLTALCDCYDAMTTDRPYRLGKSASEALRRIQAGRATQFDPDLTDQFVQFVQELFTLLRAHLDVVDCGAATWSESGLSIRVKTLQEEVIARLVCEGGRWQFIGCIAEPGPDAALAAAD